MALEGEESVVTNHAAAIVRNLDELFAAGFDLDANACGASIERVLEKFFDDGGRSLHHFAGGDLVGNGFGENVDAAHAVVSRQSSAKLAHDGRNARCQSLR